MAKLRISKFKTGELEANGLIRRNTNKPEYGSIMLIESTPAVSEDGFVNTKNRIAFVSGAVSDLENMVEGSSEGDDFCEKFGAHKIVTTESFENELGFRLKINPSNDKALVKGESFIYWKNSVVPASSEQENTYIAHDGEAEYTLEDAQTEAADEELTS